MVFCWSLCFGLEVFYTSKIEQSSSLFLETFSGDKHFVLVRMFLGLKIIFGLCEFIFKSDSDELEDCHFIFEVK